MIEQLESRNLRQGKAGVNDGVSPSYTLGKAHFSRSRRGQALTGGKGVDVVLDMVAGDYVPREMKALADDGRIVIIATLGGSKAAVDLMDVLRRRLRRLDAPAAIRRVQGGNRPRVARKGVAARRGRKDESDHLRGVSVGARGESPRAHGKRRAHRQDRPHRSMNVGEAVDIMPIFYSKELH